MLIRDIMTPDVACCPPTATLQEVARLMAQHDCGEIPIVAGDGKPVGVITDRDITIRAVAEGVDCNGQVDQYMTKAVCTVGPETTLNEAMSVMEENQIRRIIVVDENGKCCGIVAQADIAFSSEDADIGEMVREVSEQR